MKRHLNIHRGTRFQCPQCPKTIGRIDDARRHLLKVHQLTAEEVVDMAIERVMVSDSNIEEMPIQSNPVYVLGPPMSVTDQEEEIVVDMVDMSKTTSSKSSLIKSGPSTYRYQCEDCLQTFARSNDKAIHIDSVHKKIRYECPECCKLYSIKRSLLRHLLSSHAIPLEQSAKMELRKVHQAVQDDHATMEPTTDIKVELVDEDCPPENVVPVDATYDASLSPTATKVCPICYKVIKGSMQQHIDIHNGKRYQCPNCPKTFCRIYETKLHLMRVHQLNHAEAFQIKIDPVTMQSTDLPNSTNVQAGPIATTTCPICNKVINETNLKRHLHIHKGTRYQCPQCPKQLSRASEVRIHLMRCHRLDRAELSGVKVDQVSMPVGDSDSVTEATSILQTSYIPCAVCHKVINVNHMSRHLEIHSGRGYQCPHCPDTFGQQQQARRHLSLVHHATATQLAEMEIQKCSLPDAVEHGTGHTCPVCNKIVKGTNLRRHLDIHSGTRYQCPDCPRTFSQTGDTRHHLVKFHHLDRDKVTRIEIKSVPATLADRDFDDVQVKEELEEEEGHVAFTSSEFFDQSD